MTHEEVLYRVKGYLTDIIPAEDYSEVEEIIQALEQQPCDDVISQIKERIAYYENRKPKDRYDDGVSYGKTEDESGELKNPRTVEYERYSNRQIGLEEALEIIQNHSVTQKSSEDMPCITPEEMQKCKDIVKKYTPKQQRDDAISRQYLLDNCVVDKVTMPYVPVSKIENAPPVTPWQKIGRWIDVFGGCECSECGCLEAGYSDYCPNCGAKMEDVEE